MEGQWTAGHIYVCGPTWQVNEASGDKAIYSSGEHVIHFYYEGGKQTILWDNPKRIVATVPIILTDVLILIMLMKKPENALALIFHTVIQKIYTG